MSKFNRIIPNLQRKDDLKPQLGKRIYIKPNPSILVRLRGKPVPRKTLFYSSRVISRTGPLRASGRYHQRVVIKGRVVKMRGARSTKSIKRHLTYLQRSGVSLHGDSPDIFFRGSKVSRDYLDGVVAQWVSDPHHFRFIISPEQGLAMDLSEYSKALMSWIEKDLKTELQYVFCCHYDTDNPHIHVLLRGRTRDGQVLRIDRSYISHGMRRVAEIEATKRLGFRSIEDIAHSRQSEIEALRVTGIDRALIADKEKWGGEVRLTPLGLLRRERERELRVLKYARLQFLSSISLATEQSPGVWTLRDEIEETLRRLGYRQRIRALVAERIRHLEPWRSVQIHERGDPPEKLFGILMERGLEDELSDRKYLLLDGSDGAIHYVPLDRFSEREGFEARPGTPIECKKVERGKADHVIERFVRAKSGLFLKNEFLREVGEQSKDGLWKIPPGATVQEYCERFFERCKTLEALQVAREVEGGWQLPLDLRRRVDAAERSLGKGQRVFSLVRAPSPLPLDRQITWNGATLLDYLLDTKRFDGTAHSSSFSSKLLAALEARKEVLHSRGVQIGQGFHKRLLKEERERHIRALEEEFGASRWTPPMGRGEGKLVRYEVLGDGHYAVVRTEDGFAFLKTRDSERQLRAGCAVLLVPVRGSGKSFFGRMVERGHVEQDRGREFGSGTSS